MSRVTPKQAVGVWLLLVSATLITGWLAESESIFGQWALCIILGAAILKAWALMAYYMEIKWASLQWKLAFNGWAVLVTFVILAGWWLTRQP